MELLEEIQDRISRHYVNCPDCEDVYSDDQYTCTTCWNQGGQGEINVLDFIKNNPEILEL